MRTGSMLIAAMLAGAACGCPRQGEPSVAAVPRGAADAAADVPALAPDAADGSMPDGPPAPPPALPASFRAVPRVGHAGPVWAVPLGDGRVLGVDAQGYAKWWTGLDLDAPARLLRTEHLGRSGLTALAFAGPAGARWVVFGTAGGEALRWDVPAAGVPATAPRRLAGPLTRAVSAVAVAPDGHRIAVGTIDGQVRLVDEDGAEQWVRDRDHSDPITGLAFSPDGAHVAGACSDGLISLWTTASGHLLRSLPHDGPVRALAFAPDGALAAATALRGLVLWSGEPPAPVARRDRLPGVVDRLVFAPDVLYAATEEGEIFVLDPATLDGPSLADASQFPCGTVLPHRCLRAREGSLTGLAVDESNLLLAGGADGSIRSLAIQEGDRGTTPPAAVVPLVVVPSPAGDELAVGLSDGAIVRLDSATGRERGRFAGHADAVTALAWIAPDVLVSASLDGTLRVWRGAAPASAQTLDDARSPVTALALSPDGARLASGGADGAIVLWDVADGAVRFAATLDGHVSRVLALAFAPDGASLWSAGLDRVVQRWNLERRRAAWSEPPAVQPAATRLAALADGQVLAGLADGTFRRIGPARRSVALTVRCDGPVVALVAPGPGVSGVLAACGDGTLRRLAGPASDDAAWAGTPWAPAGDAVAALATARDGTAYFAGESVGVAAPAGGAPGWRTWFVPDGSLAVGADGRYVAAGAGAAAVSYSDGTTARGTDDGAVRARAVEGGR